ncbi:MAG: VWA domain-containing protein [Candidatus Heimdallarchaeota archaeon]
MSKSSQNGALKPGDELFLRWRLILGLEGEKKGFSLNDLLESQSSEALDEYLSGTGMESLPPEETGRQDGRVPTATQGKGKRRRKRKGKTRGSVGKAAAEAKLTEIDELLQFCYEGGTQSSGASQPGDASPAMPVGNLMGWKRNERRGQKGTGGSEPPQMTVPVWLSKVKKLFPSESRELLEADLIKRRGIEELIETPELLEKVEPSLEMAKLVLSYKDIMSPEVKESAKRLIRKVVDDIKDLLRTDVVPAINGALRKDKHSPHKAFKNLDLPRTLRKNLQNWDEERRKIIVDRMFFHEREQKRKPWHIITVVDESGSMMDSVIYSAVLASIFWEIPSVNSSLVIFDTEVVDLTPIVKDPVETLMNVRLGGGTYIGKAMTYVKDNLVINPAKTIICLITDFYEGMNEDILLTATKSMIEGKARVIGLAALAPDLGPSYYPAFDRRLAERMRKVGVDILACTPKHLSELISRIIAQ